MILIINYHSNVIHGLQKKVRLFLDNFTLKVTQYNFTKSELNLNMEEKFFFHKNEWKYRTQKFTLP
jgi:hypothetical protein